MKGPLRNEGWIEEHQDIPALPFFTSLRVCGWQEGKAGRNNEQLSKRERREITVFYSIAGQGELSRSCRPPTLLSRGSSSLGVKVQSSLLPHIGKTARLHIPFCYC
ncbi:hypothetical protein CDAR_524441 [Caerostris darwini]|uniref:Uncharacterized protein n=1 Tax=Caerostris darwini TaxID=1538125 RepID=A0AAV4VX53_9ARAC|nr:hypothetical protein CDAR_524441 [Caerostris darwini]